MLEVGKAQTASSNDGPRKFFDVNKILPVFLDDGCQSQLLLLLLLGGAPQLCVLP